tara:strand:- start:7423 stop:7893 length:471 start_codon:yes stop_codon:yes gene_type:complete
MSNSFINLTESTFPFVINKKLANLNGLNDLGELTTNIKVKLKIDIISKFLFLVSGNIDASFRSRCQKCSKLSDIQLNIKTEVGIKDISQEELDTEKKYEIHYQDLKLFNINKLIKEEIHLNFPSIVLCCISESDKSLDVRKEQKIHPFKKIKDLIN